ncbi:MAG: excinuclease ABC subunit UvrA [Defluviitaleaceae bacterium]|nr:excinuclease ABC subunit UvrA [Defluviitaleaceae bacterium]
MNEVNPAAQRGSGEGLCPTERRGVEQRHTSIKVIGANQNNLKNVDVEIPRDQLTVVTGVSGSGKSSLVFDVIYGEGQRRFLESISNFAKGRINQVKKPDVKYVRGLSPVVSIEQKKGNFNPRSTVGTVTDIADYLRLLYATVGVGECPICAHPLHQVNAPRLAEHIASLPEGTVVELRVPTQRIPGTDYKHLFETIRKKGYKRLLVDGEPFNLSEKRELDEQVTYEMEIIVETFTVKPGIHMHISKTIEAAMISLADSIMMRVEVIGRDASAGTDAAASRSATDAKILKKFYDKYTCPVHHYVLCELQAFHFSFNNDDSACNTCMGIGKSHVVEERFVIDNPDKSVYEGCFRQSVLKKPWRDSYTGVVLYSVSQQFNVSLHTPFNKLKQRERDILLYGTKGERVEFILPPDSKKERHWLVGRGWPWGGIIGDINWHYKQWLRNADKGWDPDFIKDVMIETTCPDCSGGRLKKSRLSVKVGGKNIHELSAMQLVAFCDQLKNTKFTGHNQEVAESIARELIKRVELLIDVGLYYLNLGRRSDSISGGEMQRIKMSTQISSELMGMLYIMDEPSIGLHPRDSAKVIDIMKKLRDIGNTVIVIEHDLETMKNADYLVEIGPGPGIHGGTVMASGTCAQMEANPASMTGGYLSGTREIALPATRRGTTDRFITLMGARENNLKNITVDIPLGIFVCVTGVSGSGKSTLVYETLFKQIEVLKRAARIKPGDHDLLLGYDEITHIINIDQSAIGRNSKSNPATYVGIYDQIRKLFAATDDALAKGFVLLDFSLTHANGTRCEHCTGDGTITTSLQFMADIEMTCPVCKGARFNEDGLEVRWNGKNISEVLNLTVEEARAFFADHKYISHKLGIMDDLGLGYMTLGQSSTTLSGGEAQRVKLAWELAKIKRGSHNLYILDEPTTGLHIADIEKLLISINKLVDSGHSVLVIEHNLDVIKSADYIIDLGPDGGDNGGEIVAQGTPEEVAKNKRSHTARFLKSELKK